MKVRRIGMRLVAAGLLAPSLASCDLFGARGPIRIAAIGPPNPAANPINGELSTTNAALPEATSQGVVSYDGGGEIDELGRESARVNVGVYVEVPVADRTVTKT